MATSIEAMVSLIPFCTSSYLIPKAHAIRHMMAPSTARTIRALTFKDIRPKKMIAIPTASMVIACHGARDLGLELSIFISSLIGLDTKRLLDLEPILKNSPWERSVAMDR